ncbi:MAG: Na+ dependent nucleoside transporter [Flavobacteriales bacterium]|jgi:CNT family concentrative nucleoside transporter|nr:Na+ dependent nucleoside transporter [Flavobacteriales bacterium]
MKYLYQSLLVLIFLIISVPLSFSQSLKERIVAEWKLAETVYTDATHTPFDTNSYFLKINANGSYAFNLGEDPTDTTKGTWELTNETLTLYPLADNFSIKVDSAFIELDSSNREIKFYADGNHFMSNKNGQLEQKVALLNFEITESSEGQLHLKSGEETSVFHIKKSKPQAEPSFTFSSIIRGLIGMFFLVLIAWLFSTNRGAIDWRLVGTGLLFQLIIAVLVLKVGWIEYGFERVSKGFVGLIEYTNYGVDFLFGQFGIGKIQSPLLNFAFKILPTIIFFSALMSLLYYWGILQKIVYVFAWVMKKIMRLSGAESLAAAGNVFLGQTESPLLVKPYLGKMTKSEIMCLMTGGMATIAGGVLASYIGFLGGDDPEQRVFFAKHLLTASIISAPAAIVAAKILVPETEQINTDLSISKDKIGTNALEAISNGTSDGLKLAVNVGAMLLVFISLMALGNGILGWIGGFGGINDWIAANTQYSVLSFELILGYIGRPIVWVMGIDWSESIYVGELLGTKTVVNEFVGYIKLGEMKNAGVLSEKSVIMSTYMLCGFANFASIGIQIGGIGALIPSKKGLLSQLGMRSLVGGTVACLLTAVVVGMMY